MRQLILPLFLVFSCCCMAQQETNNENIQQLSLLEALELFFEKTGGNLSDLDLSTSRQEPLEEVANGIKDLFQDLSQDQKVSQSSCACCKP